MDSAAVTPSTETWDFIVLKAMYGERMALILVKDQPQYGCLRNMDVSNDPVEIGDSDWVD